MNNRPLKLYVFCCSTCIDPEELLKFGSEFNGDSIKVISLPCSGKVGVLYLVKAFETGADGAVIVTCKPGECKYLEGNYRARLRAEAVDGLLDEIGLGRGRMAVISMDDRGSEQLIEEVRGILRNLQKICTVTTLEIGTEER